jgi:hypothetical protein
MLALAGTTLVGAGLYFIFLRPPLLPEDVRYMGPVGSGARRHQAAPGGVVDAGVPSHGRLRDCNRCSDRDPGATSFRTHHSGAGIGALVGAASIGWMALVNFMISSDFWSLLAMAVMWAASLAVFWFETSRQSHEVSR